MSSVTNRIKNIKQPYGGYLRLKQFKEYKYSDNQAINSADENIDSSIVGSAVDYLTRWGMGAKIDDAFETSLLGAKCHDNHFKTKCGMDTAYNRLNAMSGLDDQSIINACQLVGYDVCYRKSSSLFKPIENIIPNKTTIENIRIMVERSCSFFNYCGPIKKSGFSFKGGYTDLISSGDGDYLTSDTIWDIKVSKNKPTNKHTLQILVYYIMGLHSSHHEFEDITYLGIFNPRLFTAYIIDIADIPKTIVDEVSRDVIGYK